MNKKYRAAVAIFLVISLVLTVSPVMAAMSGGDSGTSVTVTTPEYFLVKEEPAGRWLGSKNYIHNIVIGGVSFPGYCVESSKKNPDDGTLYYRLEEAAMRYSDTMLTGLREILRNGYPYTTTICGYSFGNDSVKAQAATQAAIRMWCSYRKERENAAYNVFSFWNPEPKNGNALVKAGTAEGAAEVYGAAIGLFRLAKSGEMTTIDAAMDILSVALPSKAVGDSIVVELKVQLTNCEYATLSFDIPGTKVTEVSDGTAERIRNGARVKASVPATAAGGKLLVCAHGFSSKAASSLQFYGESSGHRQKLFVGRTDRYDVTLRQETITLPTLTPSPGPVHVSKRILSVSSSSDEGEAGELKGAHLQILDESGKVLVDWVTDGKEKEINAVLEAGKTYILHEVSAPEGYLLAPDQRFTVNADGKVSRVVMEDRPTQVEISKKSALDGSLLKGAKLQIYDGDRLVYEWITDGKARTLVGKLGAGKTYRLHEEEAPVGYLKAEDVTFTVSSTGAVDRIEMIDRYTRVVVSKISLVSGEGLKNAVFSLSDSEGHELASWVSNGGEYDISELVKPGETYFVKEIQAPAGYYPTETVAYACGIDTPVIEVRDEPTIVVTSKKDKETKRHLPGAQLQILSKNGDLIEEWVSNGSEHSTVALLEAGEEYVVHEVKAPDGYERTEDVVFAVPKEKGEPQEIVFYNKKAETPLPKTGDGFSKILLYGIFAFVTTANFHLLRERRKRTEKK